MRGHLSVRPSLDHQWYDGLVISYMRRLDRGESP